MKILKIFIICILITSCQNQTKSKTFEEIQQEAIDTASKPQTVTDTVVEKTNGMKLEPVVYEKDTVKAAQLKNEALNLLINNGNLRDAESKIGESIMYNHEDADAFYILGNIYQKMVKYDEAYRYYKRAIELNPNHIDAIMKCAILANKTKTDFSSCYYLYQACNLGDPKACEGVAKFCKE